MTMKTIAAIALVAGCNLDDGAPKTACNVQADCLASYQCVDQTCVKVGPGIDAPGRYYGSVEPLTVATSGLAAENYQTLAGVTNLAGTLGCAVAGDLVAAPGRDGAVVYAKVSAESGDTRCPQGVYAIVNDEEMCRQSFPEDLRPGCAIYKRWDGGGQQVAYQLATGGYVSVQLTQINDMQYRCATDVSIRFAGGVTIANTFQFEYNPLGPTSSFCAYE